MVASLIPTSPSQAFNVPINKAKGSPLEKPKPSIQAALRVESAARTSASPLGRTGLSGVGVVAMRVKILIATGVDTGLFVWGLRHSLRGNAKVEHLPCHRVLTLGANARKGPHAFSSQTSSWARAPAPPRPILLQAHRRPAPCARGRQ